MKRISKVSLAVVLGAALASAAFASQGNKDQRGPAPAPAHSAPAQSAPAPRVQTQVPQRTFQVAPQRTFTQTTAVQTRIQPTTTQFNRTVSFQNNGTPPVKQSLPTHDQLRGHQGIGVKLPADTGGKVGNGTVGNGGHNSGNESAGYTGYTANTHQSNGFGGDTTKIHGYVGNKQNARQDYDHGYNQPAFHFGFYLTAPTVDCVPSPWYAYPTMPAYLPLNDVTIQNGVYVNWDAGSYYNYQANSNSALGIAVNNITSIFDNQNLAAIPQLVGPFQVNIFNNGQYEYTLQGTDFQQMLQDNAANTQTISFQITNVRLNGNYATVDCAHTFNDANGNTETVYQEYRLTNRYGAMYITDFSTSTTPL
jgi:hypothetical protein